MRQASQHEAGHWLGRPQCSAAAPCAAGWPPPAGWRACSLTPPASCALTPWSPCPAVPSRSLFAIYPLASNLSSQAWADSYTLAAGEVGWGAGHTAGIACVAAARCPLPPVVACPGLTPVPRAPRAPQAPPLSCHKGWDTSSWVTGSTAGSRCASPSYSSSFDCPSSCTWTPQQLSGQCAGLALPEVPVNRGPAAACLLHPPCSAAAAGNLTAPDGPCFCCDLQLDGGAAATAAAAAGGTVPPAQLWVLFLGQLAFLLWVLLLTRAQVGGLNARGGCWKRAMEANGSGAHSPARWLDRGSRHPGLHDTRPAPRTPARPVVVAFVDQGRRLALHTEIGTVRGTEGWARAGTLAGAGRSRGGGGGGGGL